MSFGGFTNPLWFLLLIAVAALVAGYFYVQRRRKRHTMRFTNLELLDKVAPRRPGRWRHVPAALLAVALILLTVALAGPTAQQKVPRNRATVMLMIDTSLSMQATDVAPNRLQAAEKAAKDFTRNLTPGINLGLISFAGSAATLVAPTPEREPVMKGIDGLSLGPSTATGSAILSALQTIKGFGREVSGPDGPPPARIVLLSDGKETIPPSGPNSPRGEFTAAKRARTAHIPVSTISFGTMHGVVEIQGKALPVPVDDASLRRVAKLSGGKFYKASSASQLHRVYDKLQHQIGYTTREADASESWLIAGTVLAVLAAAGSLALGQRMP
jgi:Ca-activated chloride channel family protein